jgi:hypothetical protein
MPSSVRLIKRYILLDITMPKSRVSAALAGTTYSLLRPFGRGEDKSERYQGRDRLDVADVDPGISHGGVRRGRRKALEGAAVGTPLDRQDASRGHR